MTFFIFSQSISLFSIFLSLQYTKNTYVHCTCFTIIRDPLRLLVSYFHFVSIVRLLSVFKVGRIKKGYFFYDQTHLDIIHDNLTSFYNTHTTLIKQKPFSSKKMSFTLQYCHLSFLSHLIFHSISKSFFFHHLAIQKYFEREIN